MKDISEHFPLDPATVGKRAIPPGVSEALVNARTKIDRGEPLGFDIGETIARVWQQAEKDYAEDEANKEREKK